MSNRVLIISITILSVFAVGAGVVIAHAPDGGTAAAGSIGLIIAALAPVISTLVLLGRQDAVKGLTQTTKDNTEKILNGTMDAKLDAAIHRVLNQRAVGVTEPLPNKTPDTVDTTPPTA